MKKVNCSSVRVLMVAVIVCLLFVGQAAKADYVFGKPTLVPNVNSDFSDDAAQISRDGLELYLSSKREGGSVNTWVSRRASIKSPWSIPVRLNIAGADGFPSPSTEGLELYYGLNGNLWMSTRPSKDDPWGVPGNLGSTVNSENDWDAQPCISADGLSLYFMSTRFASKNNEILVTTRLSKNDPWGKPEHLGPNINSNQFEYSPFISADGLSLFFSRGYQAADVYVSRRTSTEELWRVAEPLAPVNSGGTNISVSFSTNDSTIYFARGSNLFTPDFNIWQAEVIPIVDFNGDDRVDNEDLLILIDNWGQNEQSVDIGPTSWGDGIVDAKDLEVLMNYWGQDAMALPCITSFMPNNYRVSRIRHGSTT